MSAGPASGGRLPERLGQHVRRKGLLAPGDHVLVALSGGLDSVVLLHLLRFRPPVEDLRLTAAHLDHGMRPASAADALWVAGLARAWGVPFHVDVADPAPDDEAGARRVRYAFLRQVAERTGAHRIATAHHADDQAETVLFRIVRGTGVAGLRGIREGRSDHSLVRPLLPFWRVELEGYAETAGLTWRVDATNRDPSFPRNVLRHEILPRLEEAVAPRARKALCRLSRLAAEEEAAWRSLVPRLLGPVVQEARGGRIVVARPALLAYHSAVRARLVRELARRLGTTLDSAGTRAALEFTTSGASGRGVDLAGGLRLRRDFDRLVMWRKGQDDGGGATWGEEVIVIHGPEPGAGRLGLGDRRYRVCWGGDDPAGWKEAFPVKALVFPLTLRGWRPGDRIHLGYGSKKLKKIFAEARVPAPERRVRPVLVDAAGAVVWVPGLARSARLPRDPSGEALTVGVQDADND